VIAAQEWKSYHSIGKQGKVEEQELAGYLARSGQFLLPMVDLIEQYRLACDEDRLTQAVIELASQYGRNGYRCITALLQRADWRVGKDRVERIWRREGLKVPQKQKPRGRLWLLHSCSCHKMTNFFSS